MDFARNVERHKSVSHHDHALRERKHQRHLLALKMKHLSLLLLCSLSAFGQGFTFADHPFMGLRSAVAAFTPTSIGGLAYYWDYTDLANGAVGTWTDRIQGLSLTQATGSRKPTKSATGVLFSIANNTSLTCSQTSVGSTNVSIWFVMNM